MDAVLIVVVMVATLLAAALTVPAGFGLATTVSYTHLTLPTIHLV